jgi:hypothetical protein
MSVLQLRRDMVIADPAPEAVVEIETPFPLRRIETPPPTVEIEVDVEEVDHRPRRSFLSTVRLWANGFIVIAALGAYPVMIVMDSDVGDGKISGVVDRTRWTAPWAGGASTMMEKQFDDLGWASDAPDWAPMARLTAKPAFQAALAESIGEYIALMNRHAVALGQPDPDLEAATRLVSINATGVQMRAARDALVSYDRRLRRRSTVVTETPAELAAQLSLIESWAAKSQADVARASVLLGGGPMDSGATRAVYAAKGRAMAAYGFIDSLHWPDDAKAIAARNEALAAWKAAAAFHPLIVLNGSPDGSLFGNHATSMGFLLSQAQQATADYLRLVAPPEATAAVEPVAADAVAPPL